MTSPRREPVTVEDLLLAIEWLGGYEADYEVTDPDGTIRRVGGPIADLTADDLAALDALDDVDNARALLRVRAMLQAQILDRQVDRHVRRIEREQSALRGHPVAVSHAGREQIRAALTGVAS